MTDYIEAATPQAQLLERRVQALGLTWSELARSVGVTHNYLQRIRRGTTGIKNPATVEKICSVLTIEPDDLYLAGGYLPPDVIQTILDYPQLITAVRKAGEQYRKQEATGHE